MKSQNLAALLGAALFALSLNAEAGSWSRETIAGMTVDLYVPTTAPKLDGKRALMISMGGCGQQGDSNSEFKDGSNWPATADKYGMVVAIPKAPGGGVLWAGCWDYYGTNHTRGNRHNDNLLSLVSTLRGRSQLNIDADQVYISGLSSGGGISAVMGCLAPDVFAGVGNNAGPALGTTENQTSQVATNAPTVRDNCVALAGSNSPALDTQLMSVIWGDGDYLAAPGYADVNADAAALVYGASKNPGTRTYEGPTKDGTETTWSDAQGERVSKIIVTGMSHAWPGGAGAAGSQYMDASAPNYAAYLAWFFFNNNRRTSTNLDEPFPGTVTPPPGEGGWDGCGTYSNAEHATAGRATVIASNYYYAKGTWNWMGTGGSTMTTLRETSPGNFSVVQSCP